LQDYQDTRYAARYERLVNQIRQSDMHADQAFSITEVVAKELFRRMAIKDEYEVARLHSSALFKEQLKDQFSGDYRLRFHLAPPLLSRRDKVTGQVQKSEFGGWVLILFQALAFCRLLRGTPFDFFSMSRERRRERQDLKNYIRHIEQVTTLLTSNNYAWARELLSLSAKLRGYGHVKDRNREKLHSEEQKLMAQLQSAEDIVKIMEPSPL
jgi:indolepyruvate ferredoxin oxidoreductase